MPERLLTIPAEAQLAYNVRLDVAAYQNLLAAKNKVPPQKFAEKLSVLNQLIRFNLQTSLGERYNVELSQTNYYIEGGLIKHPLYQEPFIEIMRRGQKFRQEKESNDIEREIAEVEGFEKMSRILLGSQGESQPERKIIIISSRGGENSIYQHNYFDVYQRGKDGQIVMSRFTCIFSYEQFVEAAVKVDHFAELPENPNDADFLATPLVTYKSLDQIQEIFRPQEETMNHQEYQKLLEACSPLMANYIESLIKNPNVFLAEKNYNALLKFADVYTGFDQQITGVEDRQRIIRSVSRLQDLAPTVNYLSVQTIRQIATACGLSQGFFQTALSSIFDPLQRPFSVAEFGFPSNGCPACSQTENHFHCPGCNGQISSGQGITTCPHCGLTKEQAGSKC